MTEAPARKAAGTARGIEVDGWTDLLGGLVERHPRLWIRLGNWETRLLDERIRETPIDRPIYIAGLA